MTLNNYIIYRGTTRVIWRDEDGLCVKEPLEIIRKKVLGIPTPVRNKWIARFKYNDVSVHVKELEAYQKLSEYAQLQPYLQKIYEVNDRDNQRCELIKGSDGLAYSMRSYESITHDGFWKKMDFLKDFLLDNDIPLFAINDRNVLVKFYDEHYCVPVICDFKHYGAESLPLQRVLKKKREYRAIKTKKEFAALQKYRS